MGRRKKIPLDAEPAYPTDEVAKIHAFDQFVAVDMGKNPRTYFQRHKLDQSIDVIHSWGVNGIFFVFAYPPAGFMIKDTDDVLKLKAFEGWIFEKKTATSPMNLLVKASRDGVALFWQQHKLYKSS